MNYIYVRTANKEMSAPEQMALCKTLAKKEGIEVDEIFIDEGFSGLNEQRPSYLKLLEIAKQGDTIIMLNPSRLTRNQSKMHELVEKFTFLFP